LIQRIDPADGAVPSAARDKFVMHANGAEASRPVHLVAPFFFRILTNHYRTFNECSGHSW
jgi:hypothetical protein